MTLSEALEALDAAGCNSAECDFGRGASMPYSCTCFDDVGRYDRETRDLLAAVVKAAREEVRKERQRYYDACAKEARASIEKERRG